MSATRKMTDKGEGKIGKMKTQAERLNLEVAVIVLMTFQILTGDG